MPPQSALLEPDALSSEMPPPGENSSNAASVQRKAAEATPAPKKGAANGNGEAEVEEKAVATKSRGPENPQDPLDNNDEQGDRDKESERESDAASSAKRCSSVTKGRAPCAASATARSDETEKKATRSSPPAMTEDASHLLSVLVRWVVLFSFAVILASRWHGRISRSMSQARDASSKEEMALAEGCERIRNHYEACYGDGVGTVEGVDGMIWGMGPDQCPAPPAMEQCHPYVTVDDPLDTKPGIFQRIVRAIDDCNLLLLGFPSAAAVYVHVRECLLSALCWAVTFILIRKGLNPDERRASAESGRSAYYPDIFQFKYWRGAGYGGLGVFHSAFLRGVAKNFVSREVFVRFVPVYFLSQEVVRGPVYDAVMLGTFWALAQFLFRRRLDPKTRASMFRRNWRDVAAGFVALTTASLVRAMIKSRLAPLAGVYPLLASCPKVVGDATRTGLCWGFAYIFLRRGLNPETNSRGFVARYRTDAACGSAAMFAFALLKPAARWFVVTYLESGGIGGGSVGPVLGAEAEANSWSMCTPMIGFASME